MALGAKLLLVGCGKMGGAMLTGWLEGRTVEEAVVVEPSAPAVAPFRDRPGVYLSKGIEGVAPHFRPDIVVRSEEHTSELQSLMRISYAVFCLKKKKKKINTTQLHNIYDTHH